MPLRQLQRPLLRTTIAAAAAAASTTTWRPISVQLLHGSSCRSSSTNSSAHTSNPAEPKKTLFEELFPEESKTAVRPSHGRSINGSGITTTADNNNNKDDETPEQLPLSEDLQAYAANDDMASRPVYHHDLSSLLVLSGAPKSLVESDFFRTRLGSARHVEGWSSSGITRIVPVRDPETLELLGQYYIMFENDAAAAAWKHEVSTLWRLARARMLSRHEFVSGGGRSSSSENNNNKNKKNKHSMQQKHALSKTERHHSLASFQDDLLDPESESPDAASVRHFTMVPPSQRYDLERPVETRGDMLLLRGAPSLVGRLMDKARSRFLVLVVLDGGRLSVPTLRALIREDGVERNLPWRVQDLESDDGIMAFGKSSLKAGDKAGPKDALQQQAASAMGQGENEEEEEEAKAKATALASLSRTARERQKLNDEDRRWNRFIVPFLDEAEARRFVRHWHRRQLQLRMGHEDSEVKAWEEFRTINASILW